jgi:hypothetical protein
MKRSKRKRPPRALAVVAEPLKLYRAAAAALAACVRVDEVKKIRDQAQAVALYARQAKDDTLLAQAREIKVRAERRAGEILAQMAARHERQTGGKPSSRSDGYWPVPTLRDLGVTPDQSSAWQALARVTPAAFERHVAAVTHPEPRPIRVRYETVEDEPVRAVPVFITTEETSRPVELPLPPTPRVPELREVLVYVERGLPALEHAHAVLDGIAARIQAAERAGLFVYEEDLGGFTTAILQLTQAAERLLARLRPDVAPDDESNNKEDN